MLPSWMRKQERKGLPPNIEYEKIVDTVKDHKEVIVYIYMCCLSNRSSAGRFHLLHHYWLCVRNLYIVSLLLSVLVADSGSRSMVAPNLTGEKRARGSAWSSSSLIARATLCKWRLLLSSCGVFVLSVRLSCILLILALPRRSSTYSTCSPFWIFLSWSGLICLRATSSKRNW